MYVSSQITYTDYTSSKITFLQIHVAWYTLEDNIQTPKL